MCGTSEEQLLVISSKYAVWVRFTSEEWSQYISAEQLLVIIFYLAVWVGLGCEVLTKINILWHKCESCSVGFTLLSNITKTSKLNNILSSYSEQEAEWQY